MKLRTCPWLDMNTMSHKYGIQAQQNKGEKYQHCHSNGKPLIFKTKAEAIKRIKEMQSD